MKKSLSLGMILLSIACSKESSHSTPNSVVNMQNKWPDPTSVPVCIMNRSEITDELFNDIKTHVVNDYSSKADIGFVGWADCQSSDMNAPVIRVIFHRVHNWNNSSSASAGGGKSKVGRDETSCGGCGGGTMSLDVGSNGAYPPSTSRVRDFIVKQTRATAVHEFGHAMGLLHEHERSDAAGCNDFSGFVQNSDRNVYVGEYDPDSIMNYCVNKELTSLSAGDIA
ncbi:MAG: hypothetical protein M3Q07_28735, partial [Pseudobdellovibrionaceae bacterium]|nr:hypothetical protein [Pseudobdellovibrionaceae bacterium]